MSKQMKILLFLFWLKRFVAFIEQIHYKQNYFKFTLQWHYDDPIIPQNCWFLLSYTYYIIGFIRLKASGCHDSRGGWGGGGGGGCVSLFDMQVCVHPVTLSDFQCNRVVFTADVWGRGWEACVERDLQLESAVSLEISAQTVCSTPSLFCPLSDANAAFLLWHN